MGIVNVRVLLLPFKEQRKSFYNSAYYSDLMYNTALQWQSDAKKNIGGYYNRFDMLKLLPDFCKSHPEFQSVDRYVLREAITNLSVAFTRYFRKRSGFPVAKKIGAKLSFGVRNDRLKVGSRFVGIPGVGYVNCKHCHWLTENKTDDELLSIQYHNPHVMFDGKYWFLVFGIDVDIEPDITTDEVVGVDIGVATTLYTSDGVSERNINKERQIQNLDRRLKRLQRKLSKLYERRKKEGIKDKTRNMKRLQRQIRLTYRRLRNIRENYIHHIVNHLVHKFPKRIMIEDLKVKNMMKMNSHMARMIQAQQFYRIRQLIIEKALNTGAVQVGLVSWSYPSSKKCSRCGSIKRDLKLSDRKYICDSCGLEIDRDYNAALNLRDCKDFKVVAN